MSARRAAINERAGYILNTYGDSILRYAYSYLHNMSDAEDILQDTLIQYLKTGPVFENAAHEAERRRKQTGRTVTKLLSMAACLAVIIAAASALRSPAQVSTSDDLQTNEGDTPGFVQGGADIVEPDSAAALSAAVGFEVNDIDLPFTPEQTEYISYWHELAEIDYTGEGKTACYRKAAGTEDCSGDYNVYTDVTEFEAGSITVTLKGDAGQYTLSIWTDGSYSYSLSLSDGLSLSDWQALMNSIQS